MFDNFTFRCIIFFYFFNFQYSEDFTIGYQFAYKKDAGTSPSNNGNAIVLQIAFSYDTLVESKELLNEYDDYGNNDSDDNDGDNNGMDREKNNKLTSFVNRNSNNMSNYNNESYNKNNSENYYEDDNNNENENENILKGYYRSAAEILGLNEEIYRVATSYKNQKDLDTMEEMEKERERGKDKELKRRIGPMQGYIYHNFSLFI